MPQRSDAEIMQAYLRNAAAWDARAAAARTATEREGAQKVAESYRALAKAVGWTGEAAPPPP